MSKFNDLFKDMKEQEISQESMNVGSLDAVEVLSRESENFQLAVEELMSNLNARERLENTLSNYKKLPSNLLQDKNVMGVFKDNISLTLESLGVSNPNLTNIETEGFISKTIETIIAAIKKVWEFIYNTFMKIVNWIKNIFLRRKLDEKLKDLEKQAKEFEEYMNSPEGKKEMKDFEEKIKNGDASNVDLNEAIKKHGDTNKPGYDPNKAKKMAEDLTEHVVNKYGMGVMNKNNPRFPFYSEVDVIMELQVSFAQDILHIHTQIAGNVNKALAAIRKTVSEYVKSNDGDEYKRMMASRERLDIDSIVKPILKDVELKGILGEAIKKILPPDTGLLGIYHGYYNEDPYKITIMFYQTQTDRGIMDLVKYEDGGIFPNDDADKFIREEVQKYVNGHTVIDYKAIEERVKNWGSQAEHDIKFNTTMMEANLKLTKGIIDDLESLKNNSHVYWNNYINTGVLAAKQIFQLSSKKILESVTTAAKIHDKLMKKRDFVINIIKEMDNM